MALELVNNSLARKSESEALDLISGADDVKLIKAGETFVGTILGIVVNGTGTITQVLAADTLGTDIVAGGASAQGYLNIDGVDLAVGSFIKAGKYSKGANWTSVTAGTASVYAYYKYTQNNTL
jgi:hypothetical protein